MELTCVFCGKKVESEYYVENIVCRGCAEPKTRAIVDLVKKKTGSRHGSYSRGKTI